MLLLPLLFLPESWLKGGRGRSLRQQDVVDMAHIQVLGELSRLQLYLGVDSSLVHLAR
jgi:hypothetical protein